MSYGAYGHPNPPPRPAPPSPARRVAWLLIGFGALLFLGACGSFAVAGYLFWTQESDGETSGEELPPP